MLTSYQYSQYSEKAPTAASHIRRRHQLSYLEGRYGWTLMLAGNFYKAKVIKYCEHLENSSWDYECDRDQQGPGQQLVCRHRPSLGPPAAARPDNILFFIHWSHLILTFSNNSTRNCRDCCWKYVYKNTNLKSSKSSSFKCNSFFNGV